MKTGERVRFKSQDTQRWYFGVVTEEPSEMISATRVRFLNDEEWARYVLESNTFGGGIEENHVLRHSFPAIAGNCEPASVIDSKEEL